MTATAVPPSPAPLPTSSWNRFARTAVALACAIAAVSATAAGDPVAAPGRVPSSARGIAATELQGESSASVEMVRLVPPGFGGHGPDVGTWQHPHGKPIDWVAAKRSGAGYAIVKATEGSDFVSSWFAADWAGAAKAGLPRGAYHFARPARPLSTATAQARAYLAVVGRLHQPGDLPAVLDLENAGGLSPGELVAWAQEWVRTVQDTTGRAPILYTYRRFWQRKAADSSALSELPLWIADYSDGAAGPGRAAGPSRPLVGHWRDWAIWQWTDRGRVTGVAGPVDVNVINGGAQRMRLLADGTRRRYFPPVLPGPALNVHVDGGNHSLTVSWMPGVDGDSRPTGWRVTVNGSGTSVVVGGDALGARIGGLRNGQSYAVRVEQRNAAGWSAPSEPITVYTAPAVTVTGLLLATTGVLAGDTVSAVAQVHADGRPVPGARVEFWADRGGSTFQLAAALTDADGQATADLPVPTNSVVRARFGGQPHTTPSQSGLAGVEALPRLAVHVPVSAVNGHPMSIGGAAVGAPRDSPVVLQQWTRDGWTPVGKTHVESRGRFVFVLRADRGERSYRVVVPRTSASGRIISPTSATSVL